MNIAKTVKAHRKLKRLSQVEFAIKCGVGLRFIRELEQGKKTLRLDKVNQVHDDICSISLKSHDLQATNLL